MIFIHWKENWNAAFPMRRLCMHRWCLRGMVYQYRCWKHQNDD